MENDKIAILAGFSIVLALSLTLLFFQ